MTKPTVYQNNSQEKADLLERSDDLSNKRLSHDHGMETLYGKFLRCIQDGGHVLLTK